MKKSRAYLVGINQKSFRPGEPALIVKLEFIKPESINGSELDWRPCYKIEFEDPEDFVYDWVPISDVERGDYRIVSGLDVKQGNIPKIN